MLVTAIVGAAVGANLMLIVLDMTWERAIGSRFARDPEATSAPRRVGVDHASGPA